MSHQSNLMQSFVHSAFASTFHYATCCFRCGTKAADVPGCMVNMPKFSFRTGRRDCLSAVGEESYVASKTEVHPSPHTNGPDTLKWFETNFGLTNSSEVVALMGAHTIGTFHMRNSMMPYFWTRGDHENFNNEYYKSMTNKADFTLGCRKDRLALIGQKV